MSQREIANRLDLHYNTVWKHVNDPNFRIKLQDVREATKRINAVKVRENVEKVHNLIEAKLDEGDAHAAKAATGALVQLDQIQAVACGDDTQAGVPQPQTSTADLKVLIAQFLGTQPGQPGTQPAIGA